MTLARRLLVVSADRTRPLTWPVCHRPISNALLLLRLIGVFNLGTQLRVITARSSFASSLGRPLMARAGHLPRVSRLVLLDQEIDRLRDVEAALATARVAAPNRRWKILELEHLMPLALFRPRHVPGLFYLQSNLNNLRIRLCKGRVFAEERPNRIAHP